jgi:hypothetical protein
VIASCSVDKLCIDTHPIAAALHGAFKHIAHAKVVADLLQIDMLSLVGEGLLHPITIMLSLLRSPTGPGIGLPTKRVADCPC